MILLQKMSRIAKSVETEKSVGGRGWGDRCMGRVMAEGLKVFFWGDENTLKLIVVMVAQPCE